jgi:hypothetical protein
LFGCSDPPSISVTCSRGAQAADGTTISCGDSDGVGDNVTVESDAGPPVILKGGCIVNYDKCPQAFQMSYLLEKCSIPYACPATATNNPEELICVRFILEDCWDQLSN